MVATPFVDPILEGLDPQQQQAVCHRQGPLLVIAGAGSGKTRTLVHRVAHLIQEGIEPPQILLLTYTRRSAAEMLRRVETLLRQLHQSPSRRSRLSGATSSQVWGGTFHAVASRLLRMHGQSIGLDPAFTIHDRSDSEDLLDVVRTELGLVRTDKRFPKKGTCMAIYSRAVNSDSPLQNVLAEAFPWCENFASDLKRLFQGYVDRKHLANVLDYDDLLLFWRGLLEDPHAGPRVRQRFRCVLVDEYQDTNRLQSETLRLLCPGGDGLTVVGDDAQSIYSFRAATVRNILDFPKEFPGSTNVKLEQNYRSTQPILSATNAVIAQAAERYTKDLWSNRSGGQRPSLVTCQDEDEQADFVIRQILEHREAGIDLQRQSVLFRASHHSMVLEAELARHNIPFVKYGGLKFIETAHVKDLMAFLRLAENPRDIVAGNRALGLLPGIGPRKAKQLMDQIVESDGRFACWEAARVPPAASEIWPRLVRLMQQLADSEIALPVQVHQVLEFYLPLLEERYDHVEPRKRDLEQLENLAARFSDRRTMLAEIALDPPSSSQDLAGPPRLDEDYLVLSTIHSAKGLEWDAVYVIHAADGNIPSDMATASTEQIDEERRLFYVSLTRAKDWLYVCFPQRYYFAYRGPSLTDRYGLAQLTRFVPKTVKSLFECRVAACVPAGQDVIALPVATSTAVRQRARAMWT